MFDVECGCLCKSIKSAFDYIIRYPYTYLLLAIISLKDNESIYANEEFCQLERQSVLVQEITEPCKILLSRSTKEILLQIS